MRSSQPLERAFLCSWRAPSLARAIRSRAEVEQVEPLGEGSESEEFGGMRDESWR